MQSERSCPICMQSYNTRSRREMLICLNQHTICACCADSIAQKDSKCPYCKKKYDIQEIQPLRIQIIPLPLPQKRIEQIKPNRPFQEIYKFNLKKGLCPQQHQSGSFSKKWMACNKCCQKASSQYNCNICQYSICNKCIKVVHKDICSGQNWTYDQKWQACNVCEDKNSVGANCDKCLIRICGTCENKK